VAAFSFIRILAFQLLASVEAFMVVLPLVVVLPFVAGLPYVAYYTDLMVFEVHPFSLGLC